MAHRASDVNLDGWLCKREIGRTQSYFRIFRKEFFGKGLQTALQIAHSYVLIDCKSFKLVENRAMRGVVVASVHFARRDNTNRGRTRLHNARLHCGSLRTQNDIVIDIESILHIACRVILRHVEQLEVIKVAFDFRTFHHGESHTREYIDKFSRNQRKRMKRTDIFAI